MNLKLADVFSDHLVLQSGRAAPIWGWAAPGASVKVRFADQTQSAIADAGGRWAVRLDALPACSDPRDLIVDASSGKQQITIRHVVVGEVWICSGQSNMVWPVGQSNDAEQEIRAAHYPLIRLLTVPQHTADQPQTESGGAVWQVWG